MDAADDRDRFIDAIRVGSIVVVVLGHWLMAAVVRRDGVLRADNALTAMAWLQPLTWLLQVVPLFFVAAGFANARSLTAPGRGVARFLAQRVVRVVPTPVVMATAVSRAELFGLHGVPSSALATAAVGWLLVAAPSGTAHRSVTAVESSAPSDGVRPRP